MGADGIVEVEVWHHDTGNVERKALLIQAKKEWSGTDSRLLDQVKRMETLAEGSSAAIDYSPNGYLGVDGREVLAAEGNRRRLSNRALTPVGDFLADRFLACQVGVSGLYYDSRRKLLHIPPRPSSPEAVAFFVPERLRIEIEEMFREGK